MYLAGREGLEPSRAVLETASLAISLSAYLKKEGQDIPTLLVLPDP